MVKRDEEVEEIFTAVIEMNPNIEDTGTMVLKSYFWALIRWIYFICQVIFIYNTIIFNLSILNYDLTIL